MEAPKRIWLHKPSPTRGMGEFWYDQPRLLGDIEYIRSDIAEQRIAETAKGKRILQTGDILRSLQLPCETCGGEKEICRFCWQEHRRAVPLSRMCHGVCGHTIPIPCPDCQPKETENGSTQN